jgi:hypothetical protein
MNMAAKLLAERYSRLDLPDLKAIAEAPEGEYLPEAIDAARSELAKRALDQEGEPAGLPDESPPRQSRSRTVFAVVMIFAGLTQIIQGLWIAFSLPQAPSWGLLLWGAGLLLAGVIFSYMASVVDRAFWEHVVKVYALTGFAGAASAGIHLAFGKTRSEDGLTQLLQGSLAIMLAVAVAIWRRHRSTGRMDDPEGQLARLERQGLLRRASALPPQDILTGAPPRSSEGASALEALLAERKDGR